MTGQIVYIYVDQKPEYPGGNNGMIKFFADNYKYPNQEQFQATFLLEFIIKEQGDLVAPRIKDKKQSQLTEAEKEAIRVLKKMPKWIPGKCNGENVPVKIVLPLKF